MAETTLLSARFVILAGGIKRRLLTVWENKPGDVYIRLHSGLQVGMPPEHTPILQHRYSIHPSPRSSTFTSIKQTFELSDGTKSSAIHLTDAVKLKTGFAPSFNVRFSDLRASCYDYNGESGGREICLGEFDSNGETLIVAALLGNKRKLFPSSSIHYLIVPLISQQFKIVIKAGIVRLPATPMARTIGRATLRPEEVNDPIARARRRLGMTGLNVAQCEVYYSECLTHLVKTQLDEMLPHIDDPVFRDQIEDMKNNIVNQPERNKE